MKSANRPLSPHLQVYRPQLTSVLSILHRMTGVALAFGMVFLVWWLCALSAGPEAYATLSALMGSLIGQLILFGLTFCLFYHFWNGIRHLGWDIGWGYDLKTHAITGWLVVAASLAMTLGSWILILKVAS